MKKIKKILVEVELEDGSKESKIFDGELGLSVYKGIKYVPDENGVGVPTYTGKDVIIIVHGTGNIQFDIYAQTKSIIENIINR